MRPATSTADGYERAVSAWAAHLRSGGTTTWADRQRSGPADDGLERVGTGPARPLPDAIHLELLRRINLAAAAADGTATGLPDLADRVLATPAPGRGLVDVPLPWPASPRAFGTPAVDPERLPAEELVRLGVGVLAHLLPEVPTPAPEQPRALWPLPWRPRFRLHGSPETVASVRTSLLAQGHVETDWRPTHVVIARPVEVMMAEHWSTAVRNGGILKWSTTWRRAQAAGRLPAPIDVTTIAARLEGRRREPLHVVVARDADRAAALAATVLRARPAEIESNGDASIADLLRRLNRLTALIHGPSRTGDIARTLVVLLGETPLEDGSPGEPTLVTPPPALAWARQVAAATAAELTRAGYPVHGDPDDLAPAEHHLPGTVDRERTLELAVTAILRAWHLGGNP